jgi:hypothetical protein
MRRIILLLLLASGAITAQTPVAKFGPLYCTAVNRSTATQPAVQPYCALFPESVGGWNYVYNALVELPLAGGMTMALGQWCSGFVGTGIGEYAPGGMPSSGYAVGDTGIVPVAAPGAPATYVVLGVSSTGAVTSFKLTSKGSGYAAGTLPTATAGAQPGVGTGFTIIVCNVGSCARLDTILWTFTFDAVSKLSWSYSANGAPIVAGVFGALASAACVSASCTVALDSPALADLPVQIGDYPDGVTGPSLLTIHAGSRTAQFAVAFSGAPVAMNPSVSNWVYGCLAADQNWCCGDNPICMHTGPYFEPMVWLQN